jgi:hypothetical protein
MTLLGCHRVSSLDVFRAKEGNQINDFHAYARTSVLCLTSLLPTAALAQSRTLAQVMELGAKPLSREEALQVVSGAHTNFILVNGSERQWTNNPDGTFIASRSVGEPGKRQAQGTWSIDQDGAYCLTFDWTRMETEKSCRLLYRVEDGYYSFARGAKPETSSGRLRFTK